MPRSRWLVGMMLAFLACGDSSDSSPASPASPAVTDGTSAETAAEAEPSLAKVYSWPAGQSPARDLDADMKQCGEQVRRERPELADSDPSLVGLSFHMECMRTLGWNTSTD